jgi:hypothetical protein
LLKKGSLAWSEGLFRGEWSDESEVAELDLERPDRPDDADVDWDMKLGERAEGEGDKDPDEGEGERPPSTGGTRLDE